MPHLSAPALSHVSAQKRARRSLTAAVWIAIIGLSACRDTREDTNFCSTCGSADGVGTDMGAQEDGSGNAATTDGSSPGTGVTPGAGMMSTMATMAAMPTMSSSTSAQAGAGGPAQSANAAATSGGAGTSSGSAATAGARAQAGGAARPGTGVNGANGGSGSDPDAPGVPRDAGMTEPTPDAGTPAPTPCNGACPDSSPVCDESVTPARCVECTADNRLACSGDTKTCDLEQNRCVQCTANDARNCDRETPVCNQENRCVRCTNERAESCPAAQPICIDEARCVECRTNDDCRTGDRNMCNAENKCVTCMNDAQCMDPAYPRCDAATNGCVGCETSNDCGARFPQTPFCEKQTKTCVTCLPNGESQCGAGLFCDPGASYTCAPGRPTLQNCTPCQEDKDCGQAPSISACIPHDNGRYCFAAARSAAPTCDPGYFPAPAASHPQLMYCLPINPVTCSTIANALNERMCENPGDCGSGGLCPPMPDNRCRLSCGGDEQCPAPMRCDERICRKP